MTPTLEPLVLVVDDYRDSREMYAECLQGYGFRVAEASNGFEALTLAGSLSPDVILMDLSLPGIDGWEATRQLKADARTRHIPIVALTGHAGRTAAEAARKAGCAAFVVKPALPEQIVLEVKKGLDTPAG